MMFSLVSLDAEPAPVVAGKADLDIDSRHAGSHPTTDRHTWISNAPAVIGAICGGRDVRSSILPREWNE
jgi:hypothetical protein